MAVPKKRKSHSRTRTQRSHDALVPKRWIECAQCRSPMRRHCICTDCGFYRSRAVIEKQA